LVKLLAGLNSLTSEVGGIKIHFGQGNDSKEEEKILEQVPQNGIGVMDRGFCSKERIRKLSSRENKFFVMRIKNNMKVEMLENGRFIVGGEKDSVEPDNAPG
jgi:putative transposase